MSQALQQKYLKLIQALPSRKKLELDKVLQDFFDD